jgi:NTE family protein
MSETNEWGLCPLKLTALAGSIDVMQYFVENHKTSIQNEKPLSLVLKLPNYNYSVECKALEFAVIQGHVDVVDLLLSNKAVLQSNEADNLFHLAIRFNKLGMLEYLLNQDSLVKAHINEVKKGLTPLMLAIQLGNNEAALKICNRFYNISDFPLNITHYSINNPEKDALQTAIGVGNPEGLELLMSFAKVTTHQHVTYLDALKRLSEKKASKYLKVGNKRDNQWSQYNACSAYLEDSLDDKISHENQIHVNDFISRNKIENLVFQGGGSKGIVYLGVLNYLQEKGRLEEIKRVAGTSAGAITAIAFALGFNFKSALMIMNDLNIEELLEGIDSKQLREVKKSKGLDKIKASMSALINILETIHEPSNLDIVTPRLITAVNDCLKCTGLSSGEFFLKWLNQLIQGRTGIKDLTFGELADLVKRPYSPYKHLYVVVAKIKPHVGLEFINTEEKNEDGSLKWDNVIVASAIRASMSIPGVFEPHILQMKVKQPDGTYKIHKMSEYQCVDGGTLKNYPIEMFDTLKFISPQDTYGDKDYVKTNQNSLGFKILSRKKIEPLQPEKINDALKKLDSPFKVIKAVIILYRHAETILAEQMQTRIGRTIEIDALSVETLDFDVNKKKKKEMLASGYTACQKNLDPKATVLNKSPAISSHNPSDILSIKAAGISCQQETQVENKPLQSHRSKQNRVDKKDKGGSKKKNKLEKNTPQPTSGKITVDKKSHKPVKIVPQIDQAEQKTQWSSEAMGNKKPSEFYFAAYREAFLWGEKIFEYLEKSDDKFTQSKENLKEEAENYGYACEDVPGDGNCFYHAVAKQLNNILGLSFNPDEVGQLGKCLRKLACEHIEQHREIYEGFLDDSFKLKKQGENKVWVEDIVITALCYALNINLICVRSDRAEPTIKRLKNSVCTLYLGYQVGLHYQSLNPLNSNSDTNKQVKLKEKFDTTVPGQLQAVTIITETELVIKLRGLLLANQTKTQIGRVLLDELMQSQEGISDEAAIQKAMWESLEIREDEIQSQTNYAIEVQEVKRKNETESDAKLAAKVGTFSPKQKNPSGVDEVGDAPRPLAPGQRK